VTFFDPGWDPAGWPPETLAELEAVLRETDVCLPNRDEATAMTGIADPRAAARSLQARLAPGGWAIVKLGRDGCVAAGPDGAEAASPAPATAVADSTGAGDAFNAGLLAELATGATMAEALSFAVKLASAVVGRPSSDRYPPRSAL
jgi:sugar/nucleoside kinase (ribokinase family)